MEPFITKSSFFYAPLLLACSLLSTAKCLAQDDLMKLLEDSVTWGDNKTSVVFKDTRLINAQTTKTIQAKAMVFCIAHRFGNLSHPEGVHTLYGLYDATNIRFSLDYGITDKLMAGFGKSKVKENLDASIKYRIVEQSKKGSFIGYYVF